MDLMANLDSLVPKDSPANLVNKEHLVREVRQVRLDNSEQLVVMVAMVSLDSLVEPALMDSQVHRVNQVLLDIKGRQDNMEKRVHLANKEHQVVMEVTDSLVHGTLQVNVDSL